MQPFDIKIPVNGINAVCQAFYLVEHSCFEELLHNVRNCVNVALPPDHVLIVCPEGLQGRIICQVKEQASSVDQKLLANHSVTILSFDVKGELASANPDFIYGKEWAIPNEILNLIASECISSAIQRSNAIIEAPHGYHFRKPSGKATKVFARSGNLLIHQELAIVFCQRLLARLPCSVKKLYIDSFTIHSFALCLQSLLAYFSRLSENGLVVPSIESFHSYDCGPNFRLPNTNDYFVIISASTSGELRCKLIEEHNADESKIVHLIGLGDFEDDFNKSSVYFEKRSGIHNIPESSEAVAINTEEFMAFFGGAERVRITQKHVPSELPEYLLDEYYRKCLRCNASRTAQMGLAKPLFSFAENSEEVSRPEKFRDWLRRVALYELPTSTKTIVHLNDQESKKIGEEVKVHIESECGAGSVLLFSDEDLKSRASEISNESTLVIVGNQDPDLERFSAINIRLREKSGLNRHFVLGYAFPDSSESYKQQSNDLQRSDNGKRHGWSDFMVVPIGRLESHESLIKDYGVDRHRLYDLLDSNSSLGVDSSGEELFFPTLSRRDLKLRGGSIFFPEVGDCSKISESLVCLIVAATIQKVRERSNRSGKGMRLKDDPFARTVIDPLMFTRFNDGIIQAAILRVLKHSELAYSDSASLSADFRRIAVHVIESCEKEAGEAVLEFLAAVATGKVSLTQEDFRLIEAKVAKHSTLQPVWNLFSECALF